MYVNNTRGYNWSEDRGGHECPYPGCPIPQGQRPPIPTQLHCNCPTMIVVPAGHHIHHTCPLHGNVTIHGSSVWCQTDKNGPTMTCGASDFDEPSF